MISTPPYHSIFEFWFQDVLYSRLPHFTKECFVWGDDTHTPQVQINDRFYWVRKTFPNRIVLVTGQYKGNTLGCPIIVELQFIRRQFICDTWNLNVILFESVEQLLISISNVLSDNLTILPCRPMIYSWIIQEFESP